LEKLINIVRFFALALVVAGWGLSMYFMLQAGQENPSKLLMAMFALWVSLPFITLLMMERMTSSWVPPSRLFLYALMEVVTILSAIVYSGLVTFEGRPNAFVFLVVPGLSLVIIAAAYMALSRLNSPKL
jgi:hypothetical protein